MPGYQRRLDASSVRSSTGKLHGTSLFDVQVSRIVRIQVYGLTYETLELVSAFSETIGINYIPHGALVNLFHVPCPFGEASCEIPHMRG